MRGYMLPEYTLPSDTPSSSETSTPDVMLGEAEQSQEFMSLYVGGQDKIEQVASTYMKIHKLFFGIGIYMIVVILSVLIGWSLSSASYDFSFPLRSVMHYPQETTLLQSLSQLESEQYKTRDIRIIIKPGQFSMTSTNMMSSNNLITYKGFVLPQYVNIPFSTQFQPLSYFQTGSYDISYLDLYINHFIFQRNTTNDTIVNNQGMSIVGGSFVDYFGLNCVVEFKLFDTICNQAIGRMLEVLPVYNLSQDYVGLQTIALPLIGSSHELLFCEQLKRYVFFSNDTNREIREIMNLCGKEYADTVSDFVAFNSIQDQLRRETISSTITSSALLNAYKLISTMNIIYYELSVGKRINTTRISSYNAYLESLLKSPDQIQPFYLEVVARFNNSVLIPAINEASVQARGTLIQDYKLLTDQLRKINQGDSIAGYQGLVKLIKNSLLIEGGTIQIDIPDTTNETNFLQRFDESYNFANFIVRERSIGDEKVTVSGLLRFDASVPLINNTSMDVVFVPSGQRFVVQSINLSRYPLIASSINAQLALRPVPISEVYTMIISNANQATTNTSVCEEFENNEYLTDCTPQRVTFTKGSVGYVFNYTTQTLQSFTISDSALDADAKSSYGPTVGVARQANDAIRLILNHTLPQTPTTPVGPTDPTGGLAEVQIQKNFEEIGATISRITSQESTRVIEFMIQNYNFVAVYDPSTQTIMNLGVQVRGSLTMLRNTQLNFVTETTAQKELLKNDPLTFLLQKDPLTVKRLGL